MHLPAEGNRLPWLREGSSWRSSALQNGCYRDYTVLSARCASMVNPSLRDMATFKGKTVLLNHIFYATYVHRNLLCSYYYYYYYYYYFFLLSSLLIRCLSILLTYWPCMTLLFHIIIIIIIILNVSFMQGIYTYIPETNHVPKEHCVATILI